MDYTNDIISFLFAEGKIELPGLGTLTLSKTSAHRNPTKNRITGPKYRFELFDSDKTSVNNSKFSEYISNKYNKDRKKVDSEINKYSINILNDLANFNKATIENLGYFSRKNNKINFSVSPLFMELLNESYPNFPLLLVNRKHEEKIKDEKIKIAPLPLSKTDTKRKRKRKNPWLTPFLVLTAISLIFVCFVYCVSGLFKSDVVENKNISQNDTIENSIINNQKTDSSNKSTFEDKGISNLDTNENEKSKNNQTYEVDSSTMLDENNKIENTDNIELDNNNERINNLEKIDLEKLIALGPQLKNGYNKSCIIIVGSFHRKSNADKMIKHLDKSGYKPYSEKYGKFYRTGVIFDCNKQSLFDFLQQFRQSINKGSWILKYK